MEPTLKKKWLVKIEEKKHEYNYKFENEVNIYEGTKNGTKNKQSLKKGKNEELGKKKEEEETNLWCVFKYRKKESSTSEKSYP